VVAIWHILAERVPFRELGPGHFTRHDPQRAIRRITKQANPLGLTVRFDPIEA
jgi:hypothetical protein